MNEYEWIADHILCGVDIDTKNLRNFEQDPRAAVLVYHSQSGLLHEYEAPKDSLKIYSDEIDESDSSKLFMNTEEEKEHIKRAIERFNDAVGQEKAYMYCAGCGELYEKDECKEVFLKDHDVDHLVVDESFEMYWNDLNPVFKAAHHIVKFENKTLAIAPDLINESKNSGHFCNGCLQNECPVNHSRFLDFDYGITYLNNPVFQNQLTPSIRGKELTDFNKLVLQRSIQFTLHVKITINEGHKTTTSGPKLKSHCFCVRHDGSEQLAKTLALN